MLQAGLEILASGNPLAFASQVPGTAVMDHYTALKELGLTGIWELQEWSGGDSVSL